MDCYFAPMEGITGPQFRQAHSRFFGGVDKYYLPFLSPTQNHTFSPKDLRQVSPEANAGIAAVPQLLTKSAPDFLWAAAALRDMGYREVNLNLGCPSGTVTAKGKGAGMLADPAALDRFLEEIFSIDGIAVSVKTRLGLTEEAEFPPLLSCFAKYPIHELIIHPRVREDHYKRPVRRAAFTQAYGAYPGPLVYNGGITSVAQCAALQREYPRLRAVMLGQGLLANPALARQTRGGSPAGVSELRSFHDALYHTYCENFKSARDAIFHMKELWRYLSRLFPDGDDFFRRLRKVDRSGAYEALVDSLFSAAPPLPEAAADWVC